MPRRIAPAAAGLALALSASFGPPASATSTPPARACAWPTMFSVQTSNKGIPDSAATYWFQPLVAGASTRIVVSGRYPDARYASLSVYTISGGPFTVNGVGSSLTDYQIAPDPGSRNPWRQRALPGGRFAVSIRSDVSPGQVNTLPMPPGTTAQHPGYLMFRVYLPAGGDASRVALPTLIVRQGHTTRTLLPCRTHDAPLPPPVPAPTSTSPAPVPPQLAFYRPDPAAIAMGGFPNADTDYAMAYFVRPPTSDVVVITGRAPVAAPGDHPSPWPAPGEDMRYWSMCLSEGTQTLPTVANTLPNGQVDYGCRADDGTLRDSAGDYAYVIGAESQRSAIDGVPGVTFLPFATDQTSPLYLLLLRNTLVSPDFPYSTASVTQPSDPAATAAAMGPYYPRMAVCSLAVLTTQGPQACFAHVG